MPVVVTAAESERVQRHVAALALGMRLGSGDRVAIVARASSAHLAATLGLARVGIVPVLLNPALLDHELALLLADADVAAVWREPELFSMEDAASAASTGADLAPWPLTRPMHYTSGTTGIPKGVSAGVWSEADAAASLAEERDLWGFEASDTHLVCGPLHHSAPVRFAVGTLLAGGRVVVPGPFDAVRHAAAVAEHAPTTAFMAPVHLQRLLSSGAGMGSFRLIAHAGAACPAPLKRAAIEACRPGAVWEFYGSTEGQFTACPPETWLEHPGTVGRARPGRELVVDPATSIVWCRVPPHARFEYWRAPEKTAGAWRGDAFTVGDLGRLDGDGRLFLEGRRDDLIISGGVNVYPAEIERALEELAGVEAAAVFGRDDEEWGQRVCAAVVGTVSAEEVRAFAASRLAGYKRPKEVHVVAELPVTPTGKLRRSTMAADLGLR